jgi:hypothetical protein
MSRTYTGRAYNIIARCHIPVLGRNGGVRNCNHFSNDFAKELVGRPIPGWVNRLANFGALFPCAVSPDSDWVPAAPSLGHTGASSVSSPSATSNHNASKPRSQSTSKRVG